MPLAGIKTCKKCETRIKAVDVLRVSLASREFPCRECGTPFEFSERRKWIAIVVVILIVFAPDTHSVFQAIPGVTPGIALGIKYAVALFLFVAINGREDSKP